MKLIFIEHGNKDYTDSIALQMSSSGIEVERIEYDPFVCSEALKAIRNYNFDAIIVFIRANRYLENVLFTLMKLAIKNVFVPRLFAMDTKINVLKGLKNNDESFTYDESVLDKIDGGKPYLVHLETHVVDHCNLNCKACNNFSPFVKKPYFADLESFKNDIAQLASMYSGIGRFFLLGGEPLLAPDLCCKMIKVYREYFPQNELRVLTNASLILKMDDDFWDVLRTEDVIIHISLYPPIKSDIEAIENKLREKSIKYIIFKEVTMFLKHWTEFPFEDDKYNNIRCDSAGCHFLRSGKMYKCPDAYLIGNVEGIGADLSTKDGISIYDNNSSQIIEKLLDSIDLCKKCSYKRAENINWEPVGNNVNIKDWFLPNRLEAENVAQNDELRKIKSQYEDSQALISEMKSEFDIIKEKFNENRNQITTLSNEKDALEDKLSNYLEENGKLNELLIIKEQDVQTLKKEIIELTREIQNTNLLYKKISKSISYNLGLIITYIPRKIYKFFFRKKQ